LSTDEAKWLPEILAVRPGGPGNRAIGCNNERVADRRVAMAIENWAARMVANGVDAADFAKITSAIGGWDEWCRAWCAAATVHEDLGRAALADGRRLSGGGHLAQAAVYYHFAKFLFVCDLAQMRAAHDAAVRCLNDALPHLSPPGERAEIPFDGGVLAGVLRRPAGPGPHPAVVLIPGLDSAKEEFRAVERPFLERGLATFSVDGPGQGEAEYELAIRPDWEAPGAAILDAVSAMPGIDARRIGLWGVSLGGYYAPRLASGDRRVRACVALSGPYDFGQGWDERPELTRDAFRVRSKSASEDQAARRAAGLTLAGRAGGITAPLLIVAGGRDRLTPWQQSRRLADETAGLAEFLLLDEGGHGCANVSYRHRPYAADWMARQLAR
jgi:dienelactone hydrolase